MQVSCWTTWCWTLNHGYPGLENMALIPGTVGASPVQNVGAYGVELQDRFESLDAIDLQTGQVFTLNAAQCAFGYRDSVFKHGAALQPGAHVAADHQSLGLKDRALIVRVRLALPKVWKPVLGYADIEKKMLEHACTQPTPQQLFDWVCAIRSATGGPGSDWQCRQFKPDRDSLSSAPTSSPETLRWCTTTGMTAPSSWACGLVD